MQKTHDLKLINGTYLPEEATAILLNLYDKKISFHVLQEFSTQICKGKSDLNSVERIPELQADIKTIKGIIAEAKKYNQKLTVKSVLQIELSS
ncbi:hypothetical protein [Flavobacterium sp. UMI-01]|uniref:hypothetical protein n=1 Tax=Flavobacterium sp. UMI-01 TaxID=1441053 RepID=UPI001C7D5FF3|nr:hypothetical protein [Flavobacterium sp. UMI-01]GIZ08525.1 hypothetical protein FUMI01_12520 [Flavobacterium sp. UMI-01]